MFAALYQLNPAEAGGTEWAPEYFGKDIWCTEEDWPAHFEVSGIGVDPSKGAKDKQGDYCGIVFVGRYNGVLYVDANGERRNAKDIVRAVRQFADAHKPDAVGFETDQFQQLIADQMQADAPDMLKRWTVSANAYRRRAEAGSDRGFSPSFPHRRFKFRVTPGCRLLVDQLMDFPPADHDNGPDALEQAFRVLYYLLGITA